MSLKRFIVILIYIILTMEGSALAQVKILWTKTFGGEKEDVGRSVQQTNDGGYIIAGYTSSYGDGKKKVWLIKTNAQGDSLWGKTFGGYGQDEGYSVQQTSDGGYIITGCTGSFGNGNSDVWLIKTNAQGDSLWSKTFGSYNFDEGYSVQQTNDGGYIIAGTTNSANISYYDLLLIKTDAQGNCLWSKILGEHNSYYEIARSVQQTNDGGYIIAGYTESFGNGLFDVWLIKTNAQGDILWSKTFGGYNHDEGFSVQQTSDGGYIITGSTSSFGNGLFDVWLIKTNEQGDLIWSKTFGGSGYDYGWSVQQTNDGGYIIAGYTESSGNGGKDIWVIKTNAQGDLIWNKTFGSGGDDIGYSVQQANDGGYIVAGVYNSDVFLTKLAAIQAPRNLIATPGNQQVTLIWNANTNFDFLRYRIYGGTTPNPTTLVDSTSGGIEDTVKVITGLTGGTTYYFRVTAVDIDGNESDFSNEVSAIPWPINPTGLPYHIIVTNITVNGKPVPAGAEVGVFDGELCVGNTTVTTTGQTNLDIVAWQGNPAYGLLGFTTGNPMTFKIWAELYGEWQELLTTPTFSVGDGNFGTGSYSSVVLSAVSATVPMITVQPLSLDFGAVTVNHDSTLSFTITNNGAARLTISGISSSNYQFTVGTYPSELAAGQSANINVTFRPQSAIPVQGSVTISTDDPAYPQLQITLTGQGIPLQQALIQVSPASLDFGYVAQGGFLDQTLIIQNKGTQELTVTNVTSNNARFIPLETAFTIGVGGTHLLPVRFSPNANGAFSGTLTVVSNAANNPNLQINLSGNGYISHFSPVTETGLPYIIVINNAQVDNHNLQTGDQIAVFDGELCVGSAIYNGSVPVQITTWQGDATQGLIGFTAGHSMTFKIWTTAYGQTIELTPWVTFQQGAGIFGEGEYTVAALVAESNLQPLINAYDPVLNFAPLMIGMQDTLTFIVENKGWSNLSVTNIVSSDGAFRASPTNFTLAPLTNRQVLVIFQPSSAMPYSANLTIYSNDSSAPTFVVTATGQGLPTTTRSLQVSTSPLIFPPTKIGETATNTVTLFNSGSAPVTLSSVQMSDARFSSTVNNFEIAPGASSNLTVSFTPNGIGQFTGTLTINNNSSDNPNISIAVSGVGYEGYFQPVEPTGLPYIVIIDSLTTDGIHTVEIGDEIGIFDNEICVGTIIVNTVDDNLQGIAWEENSAEGLSGFKKGNPIIFKYYYKRGDDVTVINSAYVLKEGDGYFSTGAYTSVELVLGPYYPPDPPQNLTVTDSIQVIRLQWTPNSESDLKYYNVYRSESGTFEPEMTTLIGKVFPPNHTFADSLLENSSIYYYRVTAVDSVESESKASIFCKVLAVYIDVWNVVFKQRKDGSAIVDVNFTFSGHDTTHYQVQPFLSNDDGVSWFELSQTSGEVGLVQPGVNRHFIWNFGQEMPDSYYKNVKLKVRVTTR